MYILALGFVSHNEPIINQTMGQVPS